MSSTLTTTYCSSSRTCSCNNITLYPDEYKNNPKYSRTMVIRMKYVIKNIMDVLKLINKLDQCPKILTITMIIAKSTWSKRKFPQSRIAYKKYIKDGFKTGPYDGNIDISGFIFAFIGVRKCVFGILVHILVDVLPNNFEITNKNNKNKKNNMVYYVLSMIICGTVMGSDNNDINYIKYLLLLLPGSVEILNNSKHIDKTLRDANIIWKHAINNAVDSKMKKWLYKLHKSIDI